MFLAEDDHTAYVPTGLRLGKLPLPIEILPSGMISFGNRGVFDKTCPGKKKHSFDFVISGDRGPTLPVGGRPHVMIRLLRLVKGSILTSVGTETGSNSLRGERSPTGDEIAQI